MASAEELGTPDVPAAPSIRDGLVFLRVVRAAGQAERVVQISASAGSGKTVPMRSWIAAVGLARHAAWVPVDREERDPQRFWGRGICAAHRIGWPFLEFTGLAHLAAVEVFRSDARAAGAQRLTERLAYSPDEAAAPRAAAVMRRYLRQLGTFLAPRSVDAADGTLRQSAWSQISDAGVGSRHWIQMIRRPARGTLARSQDPAEQPSVACGPGDVGLGGAAGMAFR